MITISKARASRGTLFTNEAAWANSTHCTCCRQRDYAFRQEWGSGSIFCFNDTRGFTAFAVLLLLVCDRRQLSRYSDYLFCRLKRKQRHPIIVQVLSRVALILLYFFISCSY